MLKEHLLAVKARMQASLQTAIEQENADSNKRLATKQVQTACYHTSLRQAAASLLLTESPACQICDRRCSSAEACAQHVPRAAAATAAAAAPFAT
jgi:hypothetical protein